MRDDEEDEEDEVDKGLEPDDETVEKVRLCIEELAGELNSPLEMITQKNTNLSGVRARSFDVCQIASLGTVSSESVSDVSQNCKAP